MVFIVGGDQVYPLSFYTFWCLKTRQRSDERAVALLWFIRDTLRRMASKAVILPNV